VLFMPWMNYKEHIHIQNYTADYLVLHTEIAHLHFNKYKESINGVDIKTLKNFKKVFNGHIHYNQEKDNIVMLGCPYHLNRNDLDNDKYIYVLDLNTHVLDKIKNTHSPKFTQIDFYNILEYTLTDANNIFNNNYVYIKIPNNITFENGINNILEHLVYAKNIKVIYYDVALEIPEDITYSDDMSVNKIITEYIDNTQHDLQTKETIKNIIKKYENILLNP